MVTIQKANPQDFSSTDVLFQTAFWGEFKQKIQSQNQKNKNEISSLYFWVNYNVENEENENSKTIIFPLLILMRKTFGGTTYAYAQRAPAITLAEEKKVSLLEDLAYALKDFLPCETIFLRFDLPWNVPGIKNAGERIEMQELVMNFGSKYHNLRKAPSNHLCPDTVIIDLRPSPEKILSSMRQQTRNSIRRAYKEEVDFEISDAQSPNLFQNLKEWHVIYEETAKRKGFYFEEFEYFKTLFEFAEKTEEQKPRFEQKTKVPLDASVPSPKFYLFTATKNKKMLSGLILAISAKHAYYMYAASSLKGRECMPNYGLQWEVIRFARSKGCTKYDLMGIPQNDSKNNPMAGLYIFKTGFGGQKTHFGGTWDFPYDNENYQTFKINEMLSMKR